MSTHIIHADLKGDLNHLTFKYQQVGDPFLVPGNTVAPGDFWLDKSDNHLKFRSDDNTKWMVI